MEGRVVPLYGCVIERCSHLDNTKRLSCQMVRCIGDKCQKINGELVAETITRAKYQYLRLVTRLDHSIIWLPRNNKIQLHIWNQWSTGLECTD